MYSLRDVLGYGAGYGNTGDDSSLALRRALGYDSGAAGSGANTMPAYQARTASGPDLSGVDLASANSVDLINQMYDTTRDSQIKALDTEYNPMRDQAVLDARNRLQAVWENAANRGDIGGMARQDDLNARLAGESALINLNAQKSAAADAIRSDTDASRLRDIISAQQAQQARADTLAAQDAENKRLEQARLDALNQQEIDNAWRRVTATGYVDEAAAALLGLKVGKLGGSGGSGGPGGDNPPNGGLDYSKMTVADLQNLLKTGGSYLTADEKLFLQNEINNRVFKQNPAADARSTTLNNLSTGYIPGMANLPGANGGTTAQTKNAGTQLKLSPQASIMYNRLYSGNAGYTPLKTAPVVKPTGSQYNIMQKRLYNY